MNAKKPGVGVQLVSVLLIFIGMVDAVLGLGSFSVLFTFWIQYSPGSGGEYQALGEGIALAMMGLGSMALVLGLSTGVLTALCGGGLLLGWRRSRVWGLAIAAALSYSATALAVVTIAAMMGGMIAGTLIALVPSIIGVFVLGAAALGNLTMDPGPEPETG